jgi:hypothetical protein
MVIVFKSHLLQVGDDGVLELKGGAVRPPLWRCMPYPFGLSMFDDEDVGGLCLVGAWHGGVRLVGVGRGDLPLPHQQSKW